MRTDRHVRMLLFIFLFLMHVCAYADEQHQMTYGERMSWSAFNSDLLEVVCNEGERQVMLMNKKVLFEIDPSTACIEGVMSRSKKALLLRILSVDRTKLPNDSHIPKLFRGFTDYSCLIVVKRQGDTWISSKVMIPNLSQLKPTFDTVAELSAVSDDGTKAMLMIGRKEPTKVGFTIHYRWQLWDIGSNRLLKDAEDLVNE
jgi:hypothetical protein